MESIKNIPKGKKYENFSYENYEEEFNILLEAIDNDEEDRIKYLYNGPPEKDRYENVKAYEHNIIKIDTETKYINASPINIIKENYIIATQGPKKETLDDFWTMIDQYKCNVIVMLCNVNEEGKEKCANYWNEKNKLERYEIKLLNLKVVNYLITIREIQLKNNSTKIVRNITQIHFTGWPDHDIPQSEDGQNYFIFEILNEIIEKIDEINKEKGEDPIVVHCSAGVGRTGTFVSMYFLDKEIKDQIKNKRVNTIKFSVFNMVRKLKEMRLYMVQNDLQYKFIYEFVQFLLDKYNV